MEKKKEIVPGTLHKAGEDYLEAILVLHREKGVVRSVDVANHLHYTKPSVSRAVTVLRQAGYLTMDRDRFLHLTAEGQKIAEAVYDRHCCLTNFLVELGVDAETAEEDACQIEHVISEDSFEHLKEYIEKTKL